MKFGLAPTTDAISIFYTFFNHRLTQITQHFFFFPKRKPVLKENLVSSVKFLKLSERKVVGKAFLSAKLRNIFDKTFFKILCFGPNLF
jgi:hypothetical protein